MCVCYVGKTDRYGDKDRVLAVDNSGS